MIDYLIAEEDIVNKVLTERLFGECWHGYKLQKVMIDGSKQYICYECLGTVLEQRKPKHPNYLAPDGSGIWPVVERLKDRYGAFSIMSDPTSRDLAIKIGDIIAHTAITDLDYTFARQVAQDLYGKGE